LRYFPHYDELPLSDRGSVRFAPTPIAGYLPWPLGRASWS
jgi:hypothetical protein